MIRFEGDRVAKHFSVEELRCKCTSCHSRAFEPGFVNEEFLLVLDQLRASVGRPLIVTGQGRCPRHNAEIGGAPDSAHIYQPEIGLKLRALDVCFSGLSAAETYLELERCGFHGLGLYHNRVHCDMHGRRISRWTVSATGTSQTWLYKKL